MAGFLYPGDNDSACEECLNATNPVVKVSFAGRGTLSTAVCVVCLAAAIDAVTGWKMENIVLNNLAISPAAERFRHPERFVKARGRGVVS